MSLGVLAPGALGRIVQTVDAPLGGDEPLPADALVAADPLHDGAARAAVSLAEGTERADGFAQVFPEHKYGIVRALQARGHLEPIPKPTVGRR